MDDQADGLDPTVDGAQETAGGLSQSGTVSTLGLALEPSTVGTEEGKDTTMTQDQPIGEIPAPSLVGSLIDFALADVLALLANTGQTGELEVASRSANGTLWLVEGELANGQIGNAATIGQVVFELACMSEGEFSFTVGVTAPSSQPAVSVEAVLDEVRPQVDEWREIRRVVPFDAAVRLAPEPPGQDVQIRAGEWQVLTVVGRTGHTIGSVLDELGGDQMVGLRHLRDLATAGLITVGDRTGSPADSEVVFPFESDTDSVAEITSLPLPPDGAPVDGIHASLASVTAPSNSDTLADMVGDHPDTLAAVAIMPPPIAGDPWTPVPEPTATSDDGVA